MGKSVAQWLVGQIRDVLGGFLELIGDPDARAAAGLNPDATPDTATARTRLDKVSAYFNSDNAAGTDYLQAVDDVIAVRDALVTLVEGLAVADAGAAAEDIFHFLLEVDGLNVIRGKLPYAYYTGRFLGFIEEVGTIQTAHRLQLDRVTLLFQGKSVVDYYANVLANLPTDQLKVDFTLGAVGAAIKALSMTRLKDLVDVRVFYGWDSLPGAATQVETLLERTLSIAIGKPLGPASGDSNAVQSCSGTGAPSVFDGAVLLDFLFATQASGASSKGLLSSLSFQESLTFDVTGGTPKRTIGQIKITASAPAELHVFTGDHIESLSALQPPTVAVEYKAIPDPSDGPTILIGSRDGTRLEVGRFSVKGEVRPLENSATYGIRLGVEDAALVVKAGEGDGFLQTILKTIASGGELKVAFELALGIRSGLGFFIEGGTGLRVILALGKQLGPLRIETLVLGVDAKTRDDDGKFEMDAELAAGLSLRLGGVAITVDQIGLSWAVSPLGKMGFKPPKGLGLSLDFGVVSGGGYLFFDADHEQYAGAVHIAFAKKLAINGVGIVQSYTKPDGSRAYSFVVVLGVEFGAGIQLGFGFTLNGIGGIFGQNRGVSTDALQQGIRTGALDAVLFPQNPVANAPRIVASLSAVFPVTDGQTIFGPALKLGWGPTTLIEASIGLIIEFESPRRLVLLGKATASFPSFKPVLHLELDCVGIFNPSTGDSTFDATLYRSSVGPFNLTGDIAWRSAGGGRPFWILAVGGTNPHFEVPQGLLPPMSRIGINLVEGDNPRARLEGYAAVTSNTLQLGGAVDASYSAAGFTLAAHIGADALINTANFTFIVDFGVSVSLRRGSHNLASIGLSGTITGPKPFHFDGTASLSLFFFSIDFHVSFTIGDGAPAEPPSLSVREPLVAALGDVRNWSAELPEGAEGRLVSVRSSPAPTSADAGILVHPLGELAVRERVAPLDLQLQKFGSGVVAGDNVFRLTSPTLGGTPATATTTLTDFFGVGDFLALSDSEKLSRSSFDLLHSGLTFTSTEPRIGEPIEVSLAYKTILKKKFARRVTAQRYTPAVDKFLAAVLQGAAARSPMRGGFGAFTPPDDRKLSLDNPKYTVVSSDTLRHPGGLADAVRAGASYAEAVQGLRGFSARDQKTLQVVAIHEVRS